MQTEEPPVLSGPSRSASGRSLSTARAVLQVLSLLAARPEGVRADEVSEALGKSLSTAYYLLNTLCEEGFAAHEVKGLYTPIPMPRVDPAPAAAPAHVGDLARAVDELFLRTHKRSYLGVVKAGRIRIVAVRGRQGVRRMPGLGSEIGDSAHALAMGKVVLSLLSPAARERYVSRGLKAFTPHTITDPDALEAELGQVRLDGYALAREEFHLDFCCIAVPLVDDRRRFVATLGVSLTAHAFDAERAELAQTVLEVAQATSPRPTAPSPPPATPTEAVTKSGRVVRALVPGHRRRRAARVVT